MSKISSLDAHALGFVPAHKEYKQHLVDLAIRAHDASSLHSLNPSQARASFDISEDEFDSGTVMMLVQTHTAEILGFYALRIDQNLIAQKKVELQLICVEPKYARRGLGTMLWNNAVLKAKDMGFATMWFKAEMEASKFYVQYGAQIVRYEDSKLYPNTKVAILEYSLSSTPS